MSKKILVVEDEKDIARMLEYNLKKEGYEVIISRDGEDALKRVSRDNPDIVVLDLMLPKLDGLEVCKTIKNDKKTSRIPVIILTAKAQESDKIVGLELGADDYMTKPFSPRELVARTKAVLRRVKNEDTRDSEIIKYGGIVMDLSSVRVTVDGDEVRLTSKEFELLKILILSNGRVLSRDYLLDTIWGIDKSLEVETRTVDVHIRSLRKKIKEEAVRIVTVKNYGYRFDRED